MIFTGAVEARRKLVVLPVGIEPAGSKQDGLALGEGIRDIVAEMLEQGGNTASQNCSQERHEQRPIHPLLGNP